MAVNDKIITGYQLKQNDAQHPLSDPIPLGMKFDHDGSTDYISLEDFYSNYRNFIDSGNFVKISSTTPTGTVKPKIWIQTTTVTL